MPKKYIRHKGDALFAAEAVLAAGWDAFNPTWARYIVKPIKGEEHAYEYPYLREVRTHVAGAGYGFLVLHKFFDDIGGIGKRFYCTTMTPEGKKLIKRAREIGVIKEEESDKIQMSNEHLFVIVKDPKQSLREWVEMNRGLQGDQPATYKGR